MKNLYMPLMKLMVIIIAFGIAFLLMLIINKLSLLFLILFLVYAYSILKYQTKKIVDEESNFIVDFYDFFQISKNADPQEILESYNYEMRKLNDELNISLENKNHLAEQIEEGFNTLSDPDLRLKYNLEYDKYIEEQNQLAIERKNIKFNFFKELGNMILLNKATNINLKTYIIIFSIIGLIIFIATRLYLK